MLTERVPRGAGAGPGFSAILPAPFGALGIVSSATAIAGIHFLPPGTAAQAPRDEVSASACDQLARYLRDPDWRFDLPLAPHGTAHQLRVWAEIRRIPRGELRRYGELAARIGSAARAVGQACGANPLPIVVPCHRVVSASGLGGFANARTGYLMDTKLWLLRHEGAWPR
ncbi:MAG: methylated-DNA--[protein]-cysteine S-methyltransferase [Rhodocyclaceae bacterium]|nr:methylated-DNA--[protein]-cysteine S-methyltransferase [Rhodocyclaceae bacterium]